MHTFTPGQAFPQQYEEQLQRKIESFTQLFSGFDTPQIEVFPSPPSHYRMRAEFRVWKDSDVAKYVMFKPDEPKKPLEISEFSIGSEHINRLMPLLLAEINRSEVLRHYLFQVEFLSATTGEIIITLIYRKKLEQLWQQSANDLAKKLNSQIIGRSKGQKIVIGKDYVMEEFTVAGRTFKYQQIETSFSQPNAAVCEKMLNWAHGVSRESGGNDLLELYCGNANFTLPLSLNFRKTLATEVSKTSVASALFNIQQNNLENIEVLRMSSEEFTAALNGVRSFRRLKDKDIDLASYRFSTVFVDPPRSGLDKKTEQVVQGFNNIIYISCNPNTLANNLLSICKTHQIEKLALFDQFPYTHHLECGVYLKKRQ